MISIPDHLVSFFKKGVTSEQEPSTSSSSETGVSTGVPKELDDHELGPLSYIAGYVLSKLKKKSANKKNDELQIILQNMICPGLENEYIEALEALENEYIEKYNTGLWSGNFKTNTKTLPGKHNKTLFEGS